MGHLRKRVAGIGMLLVVGCSTPGVNPNTGNGGEGASSGGGGGGGGGGSTVKFVVKYDAGPGGPGAGDAGGDAKACGMQMYNLEKLPPEVLLALDRSGSMADPIKAGVALDRWTATTEALYSAPIVATESKISWGLKLFPTDTGCELDPGVEVAVKAMNYMSEMVPAIKATTPNLKPPGGTPTQFAVDTATTYLKTLTTPNPKYILLATDGAPTCGGQPLADSLAAIAAASDAGFHTFVIGIATTSDAAAHAALNQMAIAGGEPRTDPLTKYYPVASAKNLADALTAITARLSSCSFPLAMKPPAPDDVALNIGGMRVPRDTAEKNGWNYNEGMKSIDVFGPWCDMLKMSTADTLKVDIIFGCPFVPIP